LVPRFGSENYVQSGAGISRARTSSRPYSACGPPVSVVDQAGLIRLPTPPRWPSGYRDVSTLLGKPATRRPLQAPDRIFIRRECPCCCRARPAGIHSRLAGAAGGSCFLSVLVGSIDIAAGRGAVLTFTASANGATSMRCAPSTPPHRDVRRPAPGTGPTRPAAAILSGAGRRPQHRRAARIHLLEHRLQLASRIGPEPSGRALLGLALGDTRWGSTSCVRSRGSPAVLTQRAWPCSGRLHRQALVAG